MSCTGRKREWCKSSAASQPTPTLHRLSQTEPCIGLHTPHTYGQARSNLSKDVVELVLATETKQVRRPLGRLATGAL